LNRRNIKYWWSRYSSLQYSSFTQVNLLSWSRTYFICTFDKRKYNLWTW